jgi:predicted secreted hydrolase
MWRYVIVLMIVFVIAGIGLNMVDNRNDEVTAQASIQVSPPDIANYARAIEPRTWDFPRDYGSHPEFQTEWWYYTGNLKAEDGRHFGYQFTLFRRAIMPDPIVSDAEWRTNQIYMAHFTLSDIENEAFYHAERYSRGGANLAGANPNPDQPDAPYQVWLENWTVNTTNDDATAQQLQASTFTTDGQYFGVNLSLEQPKPPALQGIDGLSPKSNTVGNASYYHSLSRLITSGTLTINNQLFTVEGVTWMDHEFSTSALDLNAQGWDWFGLILDEDVELMVGQIRLTDGGREPAFGGMMVYPDGTTQYLPSETFTIQATDTWTSPHTQAVYPLGWEITIDRAILNRDEDFNITVTPLMLDQELNSGDIVYWEGAVEVSGDTNGYGYAELTGYAGIMAGRF